jgi:hypothetical protein
MQPSFFWSSIINFTRLLTTIVGSRREYLSTPFINSTSLTLNVWIWKVKLVKVKEVCSVSFSPLAKNEGSFFQSSPIYISYTETLRLNRTIKDKPGFLSL